MPTRFLLIPFDILQQGKAQTGNAQGAMQITIRLTNDSILLTDKTQFGGESCGGSNEAKAAAARNVMNYRSSPRI